MLRVRNPSLLVASMVAPASLWRRAFRHLGGGDVVDEADLLESLLAEREADLPAVVHGLAHHLQSDARLVHFVLHV